MICFFFSSRRRHTRCALVTGVQTCALPISRQCNADFEWRGQRAEIEARFECFAELFGERVAAAAGGMEALVWNLLVAIEEGMTLERRREAHREIELAPRRPAARDRKSTRLNSSH